MAEEKVHWCVVFEIDPYDYSYAKVSHQSDCLNGQEHQEKGVLGGMGVLKSPRGCTWSQGSDFTSSSTMDLDLKDKNKQELKLSSGT